MLLEGVGENANITYVLIYYSLLVIRNKHATGADGGVES